MILPSQFLAFCFPFECVDGAGGRVKDDLRTCHLQNKQNWQPHKLQLKVSLEGTVELGHFHRQVSQVQTGECRAALQISHWDQRDFHGRMVAVLLRRDGTNKQQTSKVDKSHKTEYIPHCHTSYKSILKVSFQDSIPSRQSIHACHLLNRERDPKTHESPFVGAGEHEEGVNVERAPDRHDLWAKQKIANSSTLSGVAGHELSNDLCVNGGSGTEREERLTVLEGTVLEDRLECHLQGSPHPFVRCHWENQLCDPEQKHVQRGEHDNASFIPERIPFHVPIAHWPQVPFQEHVEDGSVFGHLQT